MKPRIALLLILILLLSGNIMAQERGPIDQGSAIVGGSMTFYSVTNTDYNASTTYVSLRPSLMYFFFPSCAIGATVEIANSSYFAGDDMSLFSIGPKIIYYFTTKTDNLYPYFGTTFEITSGGNYTAYSVDVATGMSLFLASHVALNSEFFVKFEHQDPDYDYYSSVNFRYLGLRVGFSAFIY